MKNVITLSESDFRRILQEAITAALNEIDGKTLSRIPNTTVDAKNNIQSGRYTKTVVTPSKRKVVSYDNQILRADSLYPRAIQSFLAPYKSFRFMFFAFRREGNVVHLLFEVENVRKLLDNVAILSGNVIFANTQLPGDIVIEFKKGKDENVTNTVYYKYKGNGYKYVLMPDNRTASKWNELVQGLQDSLTTRDERGLQ